MILEIFNTAGAEILAAGITGLSTYIITRQQKQKKEMQALKSGMQAILRNRIIEGYTHYAPRGYIPIYAKDALLAAYESYEALGANGVINDLVAQIRALPSIDPHNPGGEDD